MDANSGTSAGTASSSNASMSTALTTFEGGDAQGLYQLIFFCIWKWLKEIRFLISLEVVFLVLRIVL